MWNRHSVRWRSRCSRSAYGFDTAIALDPTVGSPSNLYRSFQTPFSWRRCGIATRSGGGRVARDQLTGLRWTTIALNPTVGSPSNLDRSFRTPFFLEQIWNRHSVRWRSRRLRSAYGFETTIALDPTVGSPSNLYRSFRTPFSLD
jgi:hypothetical protein